MRLRHGLPTASRGIAFHGAFHGFTGHHVDFRTVVRRGLSGSPEAFTIAVLCALAALMLAMLIHGAVIDRPMLSGTPPSRTMLMPVIPH
jgi:hypothetical protein